MRVRRIDFKPLFKLKEWNNFTHFPLLSIRYFSTVRWKRNRPEEQVGFAAGER